MRKKLHAFIFFLIVSSEIAFGKDSKSTKRHKSNKNQSHIKDKLNIERHKRSIDEDEKPFWANRGKKQIEENPKYNHRNDNKNEKLQKLLKEREDEPFWGTRGRRDSAESYDGEYPELVDHSNCKNCYGTVRRFSNKELNLKNSKDDDIEPFWGVRGRRDSDSIADPSEPFRDNRGRRQEDEPFWGNRGRKKDTTFWGTLGRREDEPFWGNRGRRDENEPFWGNRGRRQDSEPFWGNRGRRDDEPFWGNRGRRDDEPFWGNRGRRDFEPFWGNRGRRDDEPFWGNRGRRDDEPFWGNRGRRNEENKFWGARGRRKEDLKESIMNTINDVENDIEHLSRLKKSQTPFWSNRGRDSKLKTLFSGMRSMIEPQAAGRAYESNLNNPDARTLTNSRMYADQPNYILVERSSRSSGEAAEDPFYISRGKKYHFNYNLFQAARDRRGALEEIVKSVRNDPYYIARGKKDDAANTTFTNIELSKVRELVCSAVDLVEPRKGKGKREIDTDRDRRTILKKLTAQLQNDPYFVSRGKKDGKANNEEILREFINDIAEKCY